MADYQKVEHVYWRVSPRVWDEPWGEDTRTLWLYLLTNRHRIAEGLYRLPLGYVEADLQWSPQRLTQPLAELLSDGCVKYDESAQVVLIVGALEYQAPANPNSVTAAIRKIAELPRTPLLDDLLASAEAHCQPFAERLRERLRERLPQRLGQPPAPAPALKNKKPKTFMAPVHNSPSAAAPVDNSTPAADGKPSSSSDDEQTEPVNLVIYSKELALAIPDRKARARVVAGEDCDLTRQVQRLVAHVRDLCLERLGEFTGDELEARITTATKAAVADLAGTDNPAAVINERLKRHTLNDLCGDGVVGELRKRKRRAKAAHADRGAA
jgi:hypothetical protein